MHVVHAAEPSLMERVNVAIHTSPYFSGRKVQSATEGSRVVLQGTVATYFQKQMAQEIARRVEGVEQIENCLEVTWN
jgi:osmotically-inducible protein OsmY